MDKKDQVPLHRRLGLPEETVKLLMWAYVTPQDTKESDSIIGLDVCDDFKGWAYRLFNKSGTPTVPCLHELRAPENGACHMLEYYESEEKCTNCPDYDPHFRPRVEGNTK